TRSEPDHGRRRQPHTGADRRRDRRRVRRDESMGRPATQAPRHHASRRIPQRVDGRCSMSADRLREAAKVLRETPDQYPPGVSDAIAEALEAEAQVRDEMEPFVRLVSAAIVKASGDEKATL